MLLRQKRARSQRLYKDLLSHVLAPTDIKNNVFNNHCEYGEDKSALQNSKYWQRTPYRNSLIRNWTYVGRLHALVPDGIEQPEVPHPLKAETFKTQIYLHRLNRS